jgi:hypothetical protein
LVRLEYVQVKDVQGQIPTHDQQGLNRFPRKLVCLDQSEAHSKVSKARHKHQKIKRRDAVSHRDLIQEKKE